MEAAFVVFACLVAEAVEVAGVLPADREQSKILSGAGVFARWQSVVWLVQNVLTEIHAHELAAEFEVAVRVAFGRTQALLHLLEVERAQTRPRDHHPEDEP